MVATRITIVTKEEAPVGFLTLLKDTLDKRGIEAAVVLDYAYAAEAWAALVEACKAFTILHPETCADPACPAIPARRALALVSGVEPPG